MQKIYTLTFNKDEEKIILVNKTPIYLNRQTLSLLSSKRKIQPSWGEQGMSTELSSASILADLLQAAICEKTDFNMKKLYNRLRLLNPEETHSFTDQHIREMSGL